MNREKRKDILISGKIPSRIYHYAKKSNLASNYSEMVRHGIHNKYISLQLNELLKKNNLSVFEYFTKYIIPQIEKNIDSYLENKIDYSIETEYKARISSELAQEMNKLKKSQIVAGIQDYADTLLNLDKIKDAIFDKNLDKVAILLGKNIIKSYFKV